MNEEHTPDNTAPREDVGAETQHRFAYQASYAASLTLSLLEDSSEFTEVFSEHHEDILLKRRDGKFKGIQVKTRDLGGAPWKANDEEVLKALARFIGLDAQFPGQFTNFVLATNHFFFETSNNGNNLPYVLAEVNKTSCLESATSIIKRIIDKLAKRTGLTKSDVFSTLRKTRATADLPKLKDSMNVLREEIYRTYSRAQEATRPILEVAAKRLLEAMRSASALDHRDSLPMYLGILEDPDELELRARIERKRFTADRVRKILEESLGNLPLLVPAATKGSVTTESGSKMKRKLEAGGLSVVSVNLATDLSSAALHRLLEWRERFGEHEAVCRYNHLKTLVLKDCAEAHEEAKNALTPFGRKMLNELRDRLSTRAEAGSAGAFELPPKIRTTG